MTSRTSFPKIAYKIRIWGPRASNFNAARKLYLAINYRTFVKIYVKTNA